MKKNKLIASLKITFLHYLAETRGNVLRSCELSGLSRNTALRHRSKDADFRQKWDALGKDKKFTDVYEKRKSKTSNAVNTDSETESVASVVNANSAQFIKKEVAPICEVEPKTTEKEELEMPIEKPDTQRTFGTNADNTENEIIYNDFGFFN